MEKHTKRYQAPTKRWGVPTKEYFWAPKARPGAHQAKKSVPLLIVIRDILKYADNAREAKMIIGGRKVMVDGKIRTDSNAPVGLMDVLSIPELDEHYRVLFDQTGMVRLVTAAGGAENWKLCRIEDKKTVKNGLTQYNLHDGRNIRLEDEKAYDTKDVLKLEIPSQNIISVYKFKEGNMALVTGGKHIGEIAKISSHEIVRSSKPNLVHLEGGISTIEEYVFVIGEDTPAIDVPEVGII